MNIHNQSSRVMISGLVFIIALLLIIPHILDAHPPPIVEFLLKPADVLSGIYEGTGTPIHLLAFFLLIFINIVLYPIVTYLLLSLWSKVKGYL